MRVTVIRSGGEDRVRVGQRVDGSGAQAGVRLVARVRTGARGCAVRDLAGTEAAPGRPVRAPALQRPDRAADLGGARRRRRPRRGRRRPRPSATSRTCCPGVSHRREPGGDGAGGARLVVLDRGLRRLGHRAAHHRLRRHDRRPHVVRRRSPGTSATATSVAGDLGRAYPAESTVQHVHQHDGTFTITATIDLVPEYRVDGGPWITLPNLAGHRHHRARGRGAPSRHHRRPEPARREPERSAPARSQVVQRRPSDGYSKSMEA